MQRRNIVAIALGLLLTGCVTAQEQRAADEATCRSYGFQNKNDAFAECLQRIDLDRRAAQREQRNFEPMMEPRVIYRPIIIQRPTP